MIREIYLELRWLLLALLLLCLLVILLLFHPLVVPMVAHYALQDTNLSYSRIEGTLYSGFDAYDVRYGDVFAAQKIRLHVNLPKIWRGGLNVDLVRAENGTVDLNALPQSKRSNTTFSLPAINIRTIALEHMTLRTGNEQITIDAYFHKSHYSSAVVDVQQIDANITTRYAALALNGSLQQNVFSGESITTLNREYFQSYLDLFSTVPLRYHISISHASTTQLQASVPIKHLELKEGNLSIDDARIAMTYRYRDERMDMDMKYDLSHNDITIRFLQQLGIAFKGEIQSHMAMEILHSPYALPEMHYDAAVTLRHNHALYATLSSRSKQLFATLQSDDQQHFTFHGTLRRLSSNVIPSLPQLLQNRDLNASVDANISILNTAVSAVGKVHLEDRGTTFTSNFEYDGEQLLTQGVIDVHHQAAQWNGIQTQNLFPMNIVTHYNNVNEGMVALRSNDIYVTLFKRSDHLNGWGSYKNSRFDIKGIQEAHRTKLHVKNHIPSLYEFINSITPLHYQQFEYYDAELYADTTVTIDDDISVESYLNIPWYVAQSDSQTINFGHNSSMKLRLFNRYMTVDEYNVSILDHRVYAQRDSKLFLDRDNILHLNGLWIYDSLELSGTYNPGNRHINMRLHGKQFHYSGSEGDLRAAVDIAIVSDTPERMSIEGSVNVHEGEINYYPSKHYLMRDDDIIIIQDVREPATSHLFVNVHITAAKALRYHAHEIDLNITPDVTLWKEPEKPLVLLGMATIGTGAVMLSDKRYEIYPSKLYFGGDTPINPYLDLNILREIDYKKIHIYVTNTLEDPVVLFSATPSLSQNDIMSYLIFGTPANTAFEGGDELSGASAANLILGMGLKKMIGDTTGIHVDTLNIISSESGALGFEVGTQVNEKLRILLKNDSKFSAILQYKLNRWLRLDVDVKETGQGINLIYVKDLHDPLDVQPPSAHP